MDVLSRKNCSNDFAELSYAAASGGGASLLPAAAVMGAKGGFALCSSNCSRELLRLGILFQTHFVDERKFDLGKQMQLLHSGVTREVAVC